MAEAMQLVDAIPNTVQFSPRPEYQAPNAQRRLVKYALDGAVHIIKPQKKQLYNIPLNAVSAADYAMFLSWWQGITLLVFTPDLINASGTTHNVHIVNTENPFTVMTNTLYYEGTLHLREN